MAPSNAANQGVAGGATLRRTNQRASTHRAGTNKVAPIAAP